VHGYPALAAGISVGIRAAARTGGGRLTVPAWSLEAAAGDGSPVGRALEAILGRLDARGLDFAGEADIPPRAGIGSSAALAVAVARAAAEAIGRPDDGAAIDAAVAEAEAVFHGNPSGIDAAAAATGAVGRFRRGEGWRAVPVRRTFRICVGLSGRPRDTGAQVAAVGRLRERLPAAERILGIIGDLADAAAEALAAGDVASLGPIFDAAHGLLSALRLSSPELDALCHGARAAGAAGAKLTGAGGGGAVIALGAGRENDVLARWRRDGFEGFVAEVAAT
jgi:mevalonate kinase